MKSTLRCSLLTMLVLLAVCVPASLAQSTLGTIVGTVSDSSGAVVPGAKVRITNLDTGVSREATTDTEGYYEIALLPVGRYEVAVEAASFKSFTRPGIILQASSRVRVDAPMEVGDVRESVRVTAAAPLIESENARIGTTIMESMPKNLPLLGRSGHFEYIALVPGGTLTNQFRYSINGSRAWANGWMIDGVSTTRPTNGDNLSPVIVDRDTIQEVRHDSVNNNAEFRNSATISTTSKSGANELHGTFEFTRQHTPWNSSDFFSHAVAVNETRILAGTFGGPVYLPGIYNGRNKTFFFVAKKWAKVPLSVPNRISVPTLKMRAGDFTGTTAQVRDPLTGQNFPNNVIPQNRINPVALKHQARFWEKMQPNFGSADNVSGNFQYAWDRDSPGGPLTLRGDHRITSKNSMYVVANIHDLTLVQPASILPLDVIGPLTRLRYSKNFSISDTHVFSPTVLNEFRAGVVRTNWPLYGPLTGKEVAQEIGLTGYPEPLPENTYGFPAVRITGFQNMEQESWSRDIITAYDFHNHVSWRRYNHSLKFGVNFQYNTSSAYASSPSAVFGTFAFDGSFSRHPYADYLLGLPRTMSRASIIDPRYEKNKNVSFFAQDDWNVTPKLTVNLGIRYDRFLPYTERTDRLANFDPVTGTLVFTQKGLTQVHPLFPTTIPRSVASAAGFHDRTLVHSDGNNIAPRIGMAYRFQSGFVVRAGYGIFYNPETNKVFGSMTSGPYAATETFDNTITNGVAAVTWPQTFPSGSGARPLGTQNLFGANPHLRDSYAQQWNLSLGKQIWDTGFRVSYIGSGTRQLPYRRNLNQPRASLTPFNQNLRPYPFANTITYVDSGGIQSYQALQVEANRAMSKGLTFNAHWTWANNITDSPDDNQFGGLIENSYDRRAERGREVYTVRHRFVGNFVYEMPFGRGRTWMSTAPRVVDLIAGGWGLSGIVQFQTGAFFTPTFSGFDPSNTNTTTGRPDRIADGNLPPGQRTLDRWFDTAAFVLPPRGRFGNSGRAILEGPGMSTISLAAFKAFRITERVSARFQARAINAFNHPNFDLPASNISVPGSVGRITTTASWMLFGLSGGRALELGARVEF